MMSVGTGSVYRERLIRWHTRLWQRHFLEDCRAARLACQRAETAIARGEGTIAERQCIKAIRARPGLQHAYELLGKALDLQGKAKDATACFAGDLPASVVESYFQAQPANDVLHCTDRVMVHDERSYPLPPPQNVGRLPARGFNIDRIRTSPTLVDTVRNGSLWHDMHNTFVFDATGREIAAHSRGSLAVVQSLRQTCKPQHLGKRAFLLGARGAGNYFHWMIDILPKLELARLAGFEFTTDDVFVLPFLKSRFQLATLQHLGIEPHQVLFTQDASPYVSADVLVVPHLRNNMVTRTGDWLPRYLRRSFLSEMPEPPVARRSLYIARDAKASAGRGIENADEVADLLGQWGFEAVFPERLSVREQARLFASADVIVAPHGAGLANIAFCAPGTRIIELYGAHLAPCYWALSALIDLRYFNLGCVDQPCGEQDKASHVRTLTARRSADFRVDPEQLRATLRLAGVAPPLA